MDAKIREKVRGLRGRVTLTLYNIHTGEEDVQVLDNLIVAGAKESIAARLAGDLATAGRGEITWGAVGLGTTAPTETDTQLESELFRKELSLRSYLDNVATLRMFLTTSEGNGSLREFGLFGEDADATPNSGALFNRVAINREKTTANTLSIECAITVGD